MFYPRSSFWLTLFLWCNPVWAAEKSTKTATRRWVHNPAILRRQPIKTSDLRSLFWLDQMCKEIAGLKDSIKNVALITTDCFHIGGQEQLRTYARILGVHGRVAKNHEELSTTINTLADRRFILIEIATMSQRDMTLTEKFSMLKDHPSHIKTYLTLSATTKANALNDIIKAFSHLELNRCILTKTDETNNLGGVILVMIRHQLPLSYICHGQHVLEDLSQASQLMTEEQIDPQTLSSYGGFAAYG